MPRGTLPMSNKGKKDGTKVRPPSDKTEWDWGGFLVFFVVWDAKPNPLIATVNTRHLTAADKMRAAEALRQMFRGRRQAVRHEWCYRQLFGS